MKHALFLMASARENGNSQQLAQLAAQQLPASVTQTWINLNELPLEPFIDVRHTLGVYPQPNGHAKTLLEATLAATELVLVAPVYWYSLPSNLKRYLDEWSAWMRVPDLNFKARMQDKTMWAISNSSGPAEEANAMFESLRLSARFMKMHWGGQLLGHGSKPGEAMQNPETLEQAKRFFDL